MATEVELVERWRSGDENAVNELWNRHQNVVRHLSARVLSRTRDPHETARDVCQDAFIKALRTFDASRRTSAGDAAFRNWWVLLARRQSLDIVRRTREETPVEEAAFIEAANPTDSRAKLAKLQSFVEANYLPSDWDLIVRYGEGYTWKEIASAPIDLDMQIPFEPGKAKPSEETSNRLAVARRTLSQLRRVTAKLIGLQASNGPHATPPDLARSRVKVAQRFITSRSAGIARRVTTKSVRDERGEHVLFRVGGSEARRPDDYRMRVRTIINRFREAQAA